MSDNSQNNKRIAKNTLMLYIRMLFIMAVTLYTSRVILNTLGVDDYGIYNVVGGVITMLGFVNSSLSGAGARFITYALGEGNKEKQAQVFSTVLIIHYILAVVIVVLGETIGLWFVYNKLVIPEDRMVAAIWVYQCSILTTVISIVSAPFNSLIIAYEKMSAFAYISILEVLLKLGIVFLLVYLPFDKLIVYAILLMLVQVIIRFTYTLYCRRHFDESKAKTRFCPQLAKEIASYAGWTINGNLAIVANSQGINILLNLFFGPAVNAARGIAAQVQGAIMTFVSNFQTAVNPQIIKSYAANELQYMHSLIIRSTKFGFYLLLLIAFPVIFCIKPILKIWLGIVPEHTESFVVIMLLTGLITPMSVALINAIHATGDIRKFQIYEGTSLLLTLPIAYIILKFSDVSPEIVMVTCFAVELFTQFIRIWIVLPKIKMSYNYYFSNVFRYLFYILPFVIIPFLLFKLIPDTASLLTVVGYLVLAFIYILSCIFIVGLDKHEKQLIYAFIKQKVIRKV